MSTMWILAKKKLIHIREGARGHHQQAAMRTPAGATHPPSRGMNKKGRSEKPHRKDYQCQGYGPTNGPMMHHSSLPFTRHSKRRPKENDRDPAQSTNWRTCPSTHRGAVVERTMGQTYLGNARRGGSRQGAGTKHQTCAQHDDDAQENNPDTAMPTTGGGCAPGGRGGDDDGKCDEGPTDGRRPGDRRQRSEAADGAEAESRASKVRSTDH